MNFRARFLERFLFAFGEGIRRVAIRTAKIARRQPHKNAWQPGEGAFTLQAQIDFVDDERIGHRWRNVTNPERRGNSDSQCIAETYLAGAAASADSLPRRS